MIGKYYKVVRKSAADEGIEDWIGRHMDIMIGKEYECDNEDGNHIELNGFWFPKCVLEEVEAPTDQLFNCPKLDNEPAEFTPKTGDWVIVRDAYLNWRERIFLGEKEGRYACVDHSSEDEFISGESFMSVFWDEIKPLEQSPQPTKRPPTLKEVREWMRDGWEFVLKGKSASRRLSIDFSASLPLIEGDNHMSTRCLVDNYDRIDIDGNRHDCWVVMEGAE